MVKNYGHDIGTLTIVSFIHNNEAYSIRHHDSGYSIVTWQDSIRTVQSFNTTVPLGYDIKPKSYGDISISLCKRHSSTLGGMQEDHNSSNILVRKGNKIDILACYNRKDIFSRPE